MRLNRFGHYDWFLAIGAALAVGGVCLEIFRPGPISPPLVLLPTIYAETLAGFLFWTRARQTGGRKRTFWRLWASGFWLWTVAGAFGLLPRSNVVNSQVQFFRLAFSFLPQVLFMAALVMQPEISEGQLRDPVVRYEAALVALWWTYLYALIVAPWFWVLPDRAEYWAGFFALHELQNASIVIWLVTLWWASKGPWRRLYANLAGAVGCLTLFIASFYNAWNGQKWVPAMLFQALLAAAFLWMSQCALMSSSAPADAPVPQKEPTLGAGAWLASITAIGIPATAFWARFGSAAPESVRNFRLFVSFGAFAAAILLLYRWQDLAERQRERLVEGLKASVQELRRLQGHFAETEKLASLGQLAAGAAHEIYNPVAAMLGYSELLRADASASVRVHDFGRKIGEQTRRIRSLLRNLLSLAEGEEREPELVDVATPLRGALELSRISSGPRAQNISFLMDEETYWVRGDPEKLLQVFYRLLLTLSEHGDTSIQVRVRNEIPRERVTIELAGRPASDSHASASPEVHSAQTSSNSMQLSLNVCYMIIKDHGGAIAHENLAGGGKRFRVELPAAAERSLPLAVS